MRWLLYGNVTLAAAEALVRHGHHAHPAAEAGLAADAPPRDVFAIAHQRQLDLITGDHSLAEAPFAGEIPFQRSIVYLNVGDGDVEQDDANDRLFKRYKRLSPGRLYTVTGSRVKVRQLPSGVRENRG
jgi:hypothetical protein